MAIHLPLIKDGRLLSQNRLKNIFSEIIFGNVEDDYEELEIFHEFIDEALNGYGFFDKEEMSYYMFKDPLLDNYFSLVEKAKSILTEKEFEDFKYGGISGLGVARDYIQAIDTEVQSWNSLRLLKENKLHWMILLHQDYDFALSTDAVQWSHLLMELIKESIPAMENFINDKRGF